MNDEPMKKLLAYLEPKQKEALEKLSKKTRVSMNAYIREGVDMVLKKYKGVKH